jgi:hypothetical protein
MGDPGAGHRAAHRALFRGALDNKPLSDLRLAINQGQPIGNDRFYREIAAMTGQRRELRKRLRPRKLNEPPSADDAGQGELPLNESSLALAESDSLAGVTDFPAGRPGRARNLELPKRSRAAGRRIGDRIGYPDPVEASDEFRWPDQNASSPRRRRRRRNDDVRRP